jgi:trimeric autotransporter adhesin
MRTCAFAKTFYLSLMLLIASCDSEDEPGGIQLTSGNIETIAGQGPSNFGHDGDNGPATAAKLGWVTDVAVDASGNIYLTDGSANVVRKIIPDGTINTIAGTFIGFNQINNTPYAGDGSNATSAHLNIPFAITVDADGNVFIADAGNNAVRMVLSATGTISTFAGKGPGLAGYSGDNGMAVQSLMWNPHSVAHDEEGNVYIADSQNNAIRLVTRLTGNITTIAGLGPANAGYSGDNGLATAARLNSPEGVAVDTDGSVYFTDSGNNVIRKISDGIITTIAGSGATGYSGDNGPAIQATFTSLKGIATDSENNVYVADSGNNVIRMINTKNGTITTVAGDGTAGYDGDGGQATDARLSNPFGVAIDSQDNLYIADTNNGAIRKVSR